MLKYQRYLFYSSLRDLQQRQTEMERDRAERQKEKDHAAANDPFIHLHEEMREKMKKNKGGGDTAISVPFQPFPQAGMYSSRFLLKRLLAPDQSIESAVTTSELTTALQRLRTRIDVLCPSQPTATSSSSTANTSIHMLDDPDKPLLDTFQEEVHEFLRRLPQIKALFKEAEGRRTAELNNDSAATSVGD
uniref:Uncharacterized protein n=1 Tax=Chromera velia CCMP2878 TaxID=1169474 RepID=A0A0G4I995_9ALVE|eukprot:Cvel_2032.t1-p1 / transcript=Cvel_2032.t1 / gene=Cvel_2032 / organism=Chromera_velia_CCMP2878 / gene_product=hypothetical protein / transcript_product=hypothetical protein / location=Cvel_scaffold78:16816-17715(+) / protein_length=189 / sequence_SO=supercontig / SO=protein_coding / is_pseudo=false